MKGRFNNIYGSFPRALRLIWLSSPLLATQHTILTVVQALLPLISLLTLKVVIDLSSALYGSGAFTQNSLTVVPELYRSNPQFASLVHWSLLGAAALALTAATRIATAWVAEFHAIAVTDEVYRMLHAKLTSADFAFFENPDDQNNLYLAREQAVSRPVRIIGGLSQLLQSSVGLIGSIAILLSFTPLLPLLLIVSAVPGLILKARRSRRFFDWRRNLIPLERECSYFHSIMTENEGAKEIRLYGHAAYCQSRFQMARDQLKQRRRQWRQIVLRYDLTGMATGLTVAAAALLWLIDQTMRGSITLGTMVLCLQALRRGQSVISTISNATAALLEDSIFLKSYEELLQRRPCVTAPSNPRPAPPHIQKGIVFENVSFCYQGTQQPALQNVSVTLRPGEKIVLAGANGAGKSTFIKLLCRLYDPCEGRILIDGIDLKEIDPTQWRSQIGVLFQDFNTYQLSAEDNVRIGHPYFKPDAPEIYAAAHAAGLDSIVRRWPAGLKTLLGRWLHDGIEPSTGQWQKIALARAFLRPATIYLLDEPTSALDETAQREALESLQKLAHGKLTLFTSHRSIPTGLAERVILLENGSVTADSTPQEITDKHPEYNQLFQT